MAAGGRHAAACCSLLVAKIEPTLPNFAVKRAAQAYRHALRPGAQVSALPPLHALFAMPYPRRPPPYPPLLLPAARQELPLEHVAEGAVAQVVAQACRG